MQQQHEKEFLPQIRILTSTSHSKSKLPILLLMRFHCWLVTQMNCGQTPGQIDVPVGMWGLNVLFSPW